MVKIKKGKNSHVLYAFVEKYKKTSIVVLIGLFLLMISSLVTIITDLPILMNLIQNSLLYRQTMINNVENLQIGSQIGLFKQSLGNPTFVNAFKSDESEYVFVNKYFYVNAITEKNGNVIQYAVTARTWDFNPTFKSQIFDSRGIQYVVTLGKTTFANLPNNIFQIVGCNGANYHYYYEVHYIGNPLDYETYAFGYNMSGYTPESFIEDNVSTLDDITETNCPGIKGVTEDTTKKNISSPAITKWRNNAIINTFLVTSPFQEVLQSNGIGVDYRQVRILRH